MDAWIHDHAARAHAMRQVAVTVCCDDSLLVSGVYAFKFIELTSTDFSRSAAGSDDSVGCLLLTRFALHHELRGKEYGRKLLLSALLTAYEVSRGASFRLIVLDAANERLAKWYEKLGFVRSATNPLRLYLTMKNAEKALRLAGAIS
jgi:GNAT superfamily N-acetyltransferase